MWVKYQVGGSIYVYDKIFKIMKTLSTEIIIVAILLLPRIYSNPGKHSFMSNILNEKNLTYFLPHFPWALLNILVWIIYSITWNWGSSYQLKLDCYLWNIHSSQRSVQPKSSLKPIVKIIHSLHQCPSALEELRSWPLFRSSRKPPLPLKLLNLRKKLWTNTTVWRCSFKSCTLTVTQFYISRH